MTIFDVIRAKSKDCVENGHVDVEHVSGNKQNADILTKGLGRIKFKDVREFVGVQDTAEINFKFKGGLMVE